MHITEWMERVDLGREIQEVYLHSFLFKLAVGLVSIFLPLYILRLGFPVETVFKFFLVYYAVYVLASWPNAMVSSKLGYKHTSLLASPIILVFYLLLRNMNPACGAPVYQVAVVGGLGFNLYWAGMNPEVAESSHSEDRERETGYFFSMPTLASMISPAVGGLILAAYSFDTLFVSAAGLIALSFAPFLLSREHHEGMEIDPKTFFSRSHLDDFMTYMLKGVSSMGKKVFWPLYLAVVIQESASIGGAGSLLALGGALTSISLGKITDDGNRDKVIWAGVVLTAVSYLLMSQVSSAGFAFAVSLLNGLSYTAISLPVYSRAMDRAEEEDYIEYFAFRETALSIGRVITLLGFLGLFMLYPGNYLPGFVLLAAAVFFIGFFGSRI